MNKCFRVFWNKARRAWVVACEFAHGAMGDKTTGQHRLLR